MRIVFDSDVMYKPPVRLALERYRGTSSGTVIQDIFIESENDFPPELVDGELIYQIASDFLVWFVET